MVLDDAGNGIVLGPLAVWTSWSRRAGSRGQSEAAVILDASVGAASTCGWTARFGLLDIVEVTYDCNY